MKKAIIDLWNGSDIPIERSGNGDINIAAGKIEHCLQELEKTLGGEKYKFVEKLIALYEDYTSLVAEQAFCDGFKLAYRLSAEALLD